MEKRSSAVVGEIKKVIVGKDEVIEGVLMTILAGGHVLLEDVPGVGKTTLALAFSKVMGLEYKRVQFTSDTMAGDIVGFSVYNKKTDSFDYRPGAVFCNLFLGDEINRTSPKTQAALLEVMEEGQVTVDGVTYKVPEPFTCIATQNPLGSAGTQNLPESQLDRFMVKLSMGYPTVDDQIDIVKQRQKADPLDTVTPVVNASEVIAMKEEVQAVFAHDEVIRYAATLCENTRTADDVSQGVSPRAVLALIKLAKARAFVDGRDFTTPEDIRKVFIPVCAHRLVLTPKARIKNVTSTDILNKLLKDTPEPKMGK